MPAISIIIPVYNVEKYLRRCLDSVRNQTFSDWRAICIDDGSSDNCRAILDEYAVRDKRFVVIHKKNAGVSMARNDGIRKASGKYIMFLDGDDCIHPQTMEFVYKFAIDNKSDLVSFHVNNTGYKDILNGGNADKIIKRYLAQKYVFNKVRYKKTDSLINYATERNHKWGRFVIHHCYPVVHLYKRDLIKNIKFNHNIKICEDFPFFTAVLLRNPETVILDLPFYFYIPNDTSALRSVEPKKLFDNISMAITDSFANVMNKASKNWMSVWKKEFLWPFIIMCMRAARDLPKNYVKRQLAKMDRKGIFNNPPTMRARKYKRRIEKIISQI